MKLELTPAQRRIELARPWVLLAGYVGLALAGWWWLALPLAAVVCLAAFVQMHDAMHNSLGLPKPANERVLTLSGLLILKSGHGLQVTHLRHHGRCLTEADPEGAPATWSFGRVLWQGPWHTLMLRRESLRIAPHTRRIQLLETGLTLGLLAGGSPPPGRSGRIISHGWWWGACWGGPNGRRWWLGCTWPARGRRPRTGGSAAAPLAAAAALEDTVSWTPAAVRADRTDRRLAAVVYLLLAAGLTAVAGFGVRVLRGVIGGVVRTRSVQATRLTSAAAPAAPRPPRPPVRRPPPRRCGRSPASRTPPGICRAAGRPPRTCRRRRS